MRELTEEELKLAPEGFSEYGFNMSGGVFFFDRARGVAAIHGDNRELKLSKGYYAYSECKPMPKPKKPFDITKHEFSEGISISNMCKLSVEVEFKDNDDCNYVPLNKNDVIAIAKALGVTGEDLK